MQPRERPHLPNRQHRAVDVRLGAAARIVADRQALIGHAEDDLRTNYETRQADRVRLRISRPLKNEVK